MPTPLGCSMRACSDLRGYFYRLDGKMALRGQIGACAAPWINYLLKKTYSKNPIIKNGVAYPKAYPNPSPKIIVVI